MRKGVFVMGLLLLSISGLTQSSVVHPGTVPTKDYSRLIEFISLQDREDPLYVFSDFEEDFDEEINKANLDYLNAHPDLMERIHEDLGGKELRWNLDNLTQRLLFVPEKRQEYAALFESYCKDAINYVLEKTKLENPYRALQTVIHEKPQIPDHCEGITAFLVHNLAREFIGTYAFHNHTRKKVEVTLRGMFFLGQVGSYTTNIFLRDDGTCEFVKDQYTIWQNSAKNPYTALMAPVEETLHIALRKHTEEAIKQQLDVAPVRTAQEVDRIAKEWMAVEEAIVGGIVRALLPTLMSSCVKALPCMFIEKDLESKMQFDQYRHLKKGIEIVETVGCQKAIEIYKEDPEAFKKMLQS